MIELENFNQFTEFISKGNSLILFYKEGVLGQKAKNFMVSHEQFFKLKPALLCIDTEEIAIAVRVIKIPQFRIYSAGCEMGAFVGIPKKEMILDVIHTLEESNG